MRDLNRLLDEITQLTSNIETNYPELYRLLEENTLTIPAEGRPTIDTRILEDYLETLKALLEHHIEGHRMRA